MTEEFFVSTATVEYETGVCILFSIKDSSANIHQNNTKAPGYESTRNRLRQERPVHLTLNVSFSINCRITCNWTRQFDRGSLFNNPEPAEWPAHPRHLGTNKHWEINIWHAIWILFQEHFQLPCSATLEWKSRRIVGVAQRRSCLYKEGLFKENWKKEKKIVKLA